MSVAMSGAKSSHLARYWHTYLFMDEHSLDKPAPPIRGSAESEKIYRRLVGEIREYAIFMIDPNGIVLTWNAGAERLKGYSAEEVIGQHFSRFYRDEDVRAGKPQQELEAALKKGRIEDEGWRLRKDGSRFWANVIITPIFDDAGFHRGFAKITRDLTERKLSEETLRVELIERRNAEAELRLARAELERRVEERTAALAHANEELQNASRMKDQFLAMLSHELRTPLTSVYGWVSMLRGGKVDPGKIDMALEVIERNAKAQIQLVDDLLNVSRVITGNLKISPQWIDPLSIVHAAVDSIRPAANAKGINLVVQADSEESILADPDRLQQVLWNLLSNAVKFTGKDGIIKIQIGRTASKIEIRISDTGEGIDPAFLPFAFDVFTQSDSSATRTHGGLGLGLSIVRHIVELHGGTVIAQSEGKGRGTTFKVLLPIPAIHTVRDTRP